MLDLGIPSLHTTLSINTSATYLAKKESFKGDKVSVLAQSVNHHHNQIHTPALGSPPSTKFMV